jgi:hypothetical protein
MKKLVTFASVVRVNTLLCCSAAVLLTACGGGTTDAGNGQQTQTAAYIYNSATTDAGADAATTPAVAGEATAQGAANFDLAGYDSHPLTTVPEGQAAETAATDATAAPTAAAADAQANAAPAGTASAGGTRLLASAVAVNVATPATTYNYYVSPTGSDTAAGTKAAPFKTLARAAKAATRPSTTVWVAPGTYAGGLKTTASGTSSGRIYWVSTTKWGAKIVPPSSSSNSYAFDNRGSYVNIVGFNIDGAVSGSGTKWLHGIYMGGSYGVVQENRVHHIAKNVSCSSGGGSAINTDAYYGGKWNDVISNQVHDVGPAGCKFIQGIYISTSGSVKNNVVFRVGEAAIHLWHDANHVTITNNTITSSHYGIIVGGGDFYKISTGNDYTVVNSNIVFDNTYGISEQGKTGTHNSYSNNLVYGNTGSNISLKNGLTAKNTIAKNPLFTSYARSTYMPNFKPTAASPAVGKGIAAGAHPTDFDGKPRNASTGYDIGAYQH